MIKVMGKDGQQKLIKSNELLDHLNSGEYEVDPNTEISVQHKQYGRLKIPASELERQLSEGSQIIGEDVIEAENKASEIESDPVAALEASAAGAARGIIPFGLSDLVVTRMGVSPDRLREIKEAHPDLSTASEIGAFIGSSIIPNPLAPIKALDYASKALGLGEKALKASEYLGKAGKIATSYEPLLKVSAAAERATEKFIQKMFGKATSISGRIAQKAAKSVGGGVGLVPSMIQLEASQFLSEKVLENKGFNIESLFNWESLENGGKKVLFGTAVASGIPFLGSALFKGFTTTAKKTSETFSKISPFKMTRPEERILKAFGAETGSYLKKASDKQKKELSEYFKILTDEEIYPAKNITEDYRAKKQQYTQEGFTTPDIIKKLNEDFPDLAGKAQDFLESKEVKLPFKAIFENPRAIQEKNNYVMDVGVKLMDRSKEDLDKFYLSVINRKWEELPEIGSMFRGISDKELKALRKEPDEIIRDLDKGFKEIMDPTMNPKIAEKFDEFAMNLRKSILQDGGIVKPSTIIQARRAFDRNIIQGLGSDFNRSVAKELTPLRHVFEKHLEDIVEKTIGKKFNIDNLEKIESDLKFSRDKMQSESEALNQRLNEKLQEKFSGDQEAFNRYASRYGAKLSEKKLYDKALSEYKRLDEEYRLARSYKDYLDGKKLYRNASVADELLERKISREIKNNFFSLTAYLSAIGAGAMSGSIEGGAAAGLGAAFARKASQEYGDLFLAYLGENFYKPVANNFKKIGDIAKDIVDPLGAKSKVVVPYTLLKVDYKEDKIEEDAKTIEEFNQNPEAFLEEFRSKNLAFYDNLPDDAIYMEEFIRSAGSFLNERNPYKNKDAMVRNRQVSNTEKMKFVRYLNYVDNAENIFEEIKKGYISAEALDTLANVYSNTYAALKEAVMISFSGLSEEDKNKLSMNQLSLINKILGGGGSQLFAPKNISLLQSNFQQTQPNIKSSPKVSKAPNRTMTEFQRNLDNEV